MDQKAKNDGLKVENFTHVHIVHDGSVWNAMRISSVFQVPGRALPHAHRPRAQHPGPRLRHHWKARAGKTQGIHLEFFYTAVNYQIDQLGDEVCMQDLAFT